MFTRIIYENSAAIFTIIAFFVAFLIFAAVSLRALRMNRSQTDKFSNLPFGTATPPAQNGPSQAH